MPPVDGTGRNGVCLLGEAYGQAEAARQTPFVGPSGFRLEKLIQNLGCQRADFLITNVCWERPPNNREPTAEEVEQWRPHWEAAIREHQIKVVVPLGNVPLRAILDLWGIQGYRGYIWRSELLGCWVLPTVHPAFLLRGNANWTAAWLRDVQTALRVAQEGHPGTPRRELTLDPPPDVAASWGHQWAAAGRPALAFDIETPDKSDNEEENEAEAQGTQAGTIYRIGLAYRHQGRTLVLSVPWGAEFAVLAKRWLLDASVSIVWNRHFDVPRLCAHGVAFGTYPFDAQEMWHVLHTDLKKSLEFVAPFLVPGQLYWKDQAHERPAYYNAIDAAVTAEAYDVLWGPGLGPCVQITQEHPSPVERTDDDIPF